MVKIFEILSKLEKLSVIEALYVFKDNSKYSLARFIILFLISFESGPTVLCMTLLTVFLLKILNIAFQSYASAISIIRQTKIIILDYSNFSIFTLHRCSYRNDILSFTKMLMIKKVYIISSVFFFRTVPFHYSVEDLFF
jgi:hypothetical protein